MEDTSTTLSVFDALERNDHEFHPISHAHRVKLFAVGIALGAALWAALAMIG